MALVGSGSRVEGRARLLEAMIGLVWPSEKSSVLSTVAVAAELRNIAVLTLQWTLLFLSNWRPPSRQGS